MLNEDIAVVLITEEESDKHALLCLSLDGISYIQSDYLSATYSEERNRPVLFSIGNEFGVIINPNELFYHASIDSEAERVNINNGNLFSRVLPQRVRIGYSSPPVSNVSKLPVCFESNIFDGSSRYYAFLDFNIEKRRAKWISWSSLNNQPKLDSIMLKDENVYVFTSGEKHTSVEKWGMDYYTIIRSNIKNKSVEVLLDSGDLRSIDDKKRGVHGKFTACGKYVIMTPVFNNDEWKGKQKLFILDTKELIDIEYPRGFGKRPRVIQFFGERCFVFLPETKQFAICRKI